MRHRVWLLFLLLLQGCAGTPLAEQLERSFATPDDPAPAESPATAPVQPQQTTPAKVALNTGAGKNEPVTKPEPVSRVEAAAEAGIVPAEPVRPRPRQPLAPYRITIRLAGADPSAPAETVTQALRASAVDFMVERIERVVP